ncbi:MAG: hypothetical protein U0821_14590 [Chloroflexota bacterium]
MRLALSLPLTLAFGGPTPSSAQVQVAIPENNPFGINVGRLSQERFVAASGGLANSAGGDWGYITITWTDADRDAPNAETIRSQFLDRCYEFHLHPIIRVATHHDDSIERWKRPEPDDPARWKAFLEAGNWPTEYVYVIVGNEPNLGFEWGGEVDAADYARYLDKFIKTFEGSPRFRIVNAPLDASNHTELPKMQDAYEFIGGMKAAVPNIFDRLAAWASNPYRVPSGGDGLRFTHLAYQPELEAIGRDMAVIITESGLMETGDQFATADFFERAYRDWLQDPRIVAATPLFWDPHKNDFWMFAPYSDGTIQRGSPTYDRIFGFPKPAGSPNYLHPMSRPGGSAAAPRPAGASMRTGGAAPVVFAPVNTQRTAPPTRS